MIDQKNASVNVAATTTPSTQPNWVPSRKFLASGLGGIIYSLGAFELQKYTGFVVPAELQPCIVTFIMSAIYYIVPPSAKDVIRNLNNEIVQMANDDPTSPVQIPVITVAQAVPVVVGTQAPGGPVVMNQGVSK